MIKQEIHKGYPVNYYDDWDNEVIGVSIWNKESNKTLMILEVPSWRSLENDDEDYLNNCLRLIPTEIFWEVIDKILSHIDECNYCILNRETGYVTIIEEED